MADVKFLAEIKILAFQNPEFKTLAELKFLNFEDL